MSQIKRCEKCNARVLPKTDGTCPSCGHVLRGASSVTDSAVSVGTIVTDTNRSGLVHPEDVSTGFLRRLLRWTRSSERPASDENEEEGTRNESAEVEESNDR